MRMTQTGSEISDERLLATLDLCLTLTPTERNIVTEAMAKLVELGRLPKKQRDWCFSIARAKGLFGRTEIKPVRRKPGGLNGFDPFTTIVTPGTHFADTVLGSRLSEDGKRIVQTKPLPLRPPMKRSA